MKVLFVVSGNVKLMPFIEEQKYALEEYGFNVDYFYIRGRGILGYLKNIFIFNNFLNENEYEIVHAHYGLAGLFACLQRKVPVVVTFHGSDINFRKNRIFSFFASRICRFSIFVNKLMPSYIGAKKNFAVIPCGVDQSIFHSIDKSFARRKLGLDLDKKYILFSSAFGNPVKNYPLAKESINCLANEVILLELKNCNREQVSLLMNACDLLLMTSFSEGSPQVVKEALFCGTPVVSTKVGDVPDLIGGVQGCYLADSNPFDLAKKINLALSYPTQIKISCLVDNLSLRSVAKKISDIYRSVT